MNQTLRRVYRLALSLADQGHGALITVGDHEGVLEYCEEPSNDPLAWTPFELAAIDPSLVLGLLAADGATIIDETGTVHLTRATVRVPAGVVAEEEVGRGIKHRTAAQITAISGAVAFAVSVDGRISVYVDGAKADARYA
jgi:DNA integrity scanning protein DisA with diadenylate cyclase activity